MKRALIRILWVLGVLALIIGLGVSNYLAFKRAARLDRALMDAQARLVQLEGELASRAPAQPAPPASTDPAKATPPATADLARGAAVRYVAVGTAGLTNLVRIEGTSSIHLWQVEGHLIGGNGEFETGFPSGAAGQAVNARVNVFIPVRSLKSVEKDGSHYSDAMDEIMYGKLLEEANRRITYTLTALKLKTAGDAKAPWVYEATGNLCVAGQTNVILIPVEVSAAQGKLRFTGSVKTRMTDFKISPPSPSLGGMKITTGDEVTLRFEWWMKQVE